MRSARRSRTERGSVRALNPTQARMVWKTLCETIIACAADPEAVPLALIDPLRETPKGSFPLPAGDGRLAWAVDLRDQAERWRTTTSYELRREFAPALAALAGAVLQLLWVLGAAEAAAYRSRTGQRDDD